MCELMALSFDRPTPAGFALREFGPRSVENPDGWGLGYYTDRSLALVKEPLQWSESRFARFLETDPLPPGRIYLAHVRHKTVGGAPAHADTHPFNRELGGREYCFAHNGTLDGPAWDLPLGRHQPLGATDSERFFCHLLARFEQRGAGLDAADDWHWLHETLCAANRYGKLNVLLSDGRRLFVYHDAKGWKGLNVREARSLSTLATEPDLERSFDQGLAIATFPLSSEGWQPFQHGELIVAEAGQLRFSSHRKV